MDLEAAKKSLVQEAGELLAEMERALLEMEKDGPSDEAIGAVFRAAHTIKGSVGLFGLEHIVRFTHSLESVLDEVRAGRAAMDPELISILLESKDHLDLLMGGVERNADGDELEPEVRAALLSRLESRHPHSKALSAVAPAVHRAEVLEKDSSGADSWHISLRLAPEVLQSGMDPLSVLHYLVRLGEIIHIEALDDNLPPVSEMDPELLYMGFELQFRSSASRAEIEAAFEFVSEGSVIRILPPHSRVEQYLELVESLPEPTLRLGEILVACGALTKNELERTLKNQRPSDPVHEPIGKILVNENIVPPVVVDAALHKQKAMRDRTGSDNRTVKVEAEKLDALIDLVGELVIASAAARVAALDEGAKASVEAVGTLATLVEEIRDSALGLRMVPIGEIFQRFPRMVRDISRDLGKRVELVISGAEAELDKSMVDRIADPLTHIVRNSLDHGLETPEVRLAAGKPAQGTLSFNAYHETGSIVLEVSDDGAGIRKEKVLAKAIERGIVQPGQELSDREILNLVFEAGFSTADSVSDLSGRGVGMDVVRRNVEALRGTVSVHSRPGAGSAIEVRLPLTLAIIDGFLVGVGPSKFVLPLEAVVEVIENRPLRGAHDGRGRGVVDLRGQALPVVDLRSLYALQSPEPPRASVVVLQAGTQRCGVIVDQLLGQHQTVIKPLGRMFRSLRGMSGSTILGNGDVALIFDVNALALLAAEAPSHPHTNSASPTLQGQVQ